MKTNFAVRTYGDLKLAFVIINKMVSLLEIPSAGMSWAHPNHWKELVSFSNFERNPSITNNGRYDYIVFTSGTCVDHRPTPDNCVVITIDELMMMEKPKFTKKDLVAGNQFTNGCPMWLVYDFGKWRMGGESGEPFRLFTDIAMNDSEMLDFLDNGNYRKVN